MEDKLITRIFNFSGASKNTEQLFNLTEEQYKEEIEFFYEALTERINKEYNIPSEIPKSIELILIELTSNLIRSHAIRQNMNLIDDEEFSVDQAINAIFTDDIKEQLQPYKKKRKFKVFSI